MIELTRLTNPTHTSTKPRSQWLLWLGLSLLISAIYGWITIDKAYEPYIIQDDARHYVYWMRRLVDAELFPNDLIADYFNPWLRGDTRRCFGCLPSWALTRSPLSAFPLGLGLVTSAYCFAVSWQILPVPIAGFLSTLLMNQTLWAHDDTASATPRAFLNPLFLAFLYYLLRRQLIPCIIAIALLGLFYPQYVLYGSGVLVLRLLIWDNGRLRLTRQRQDYWFVGVALAVAAVVLGIFALDTSQYGPIISLEQARQMPEFYKDGRSEFFQDSAWEYWVSGDRTGILPTQRVPIAWVSLLLPLLLRFRQRFPLAQRVTDNGAILLQLTLVAFGLFFAAHAVLFKLYLPSRYTTHSLRIVLAIAAGVTLTILLDAALRWLMGQSNLKKNLGLGAIALLSALILLYPNFTQDFPRGNYEEGKAPELYQFLAQQPKETLVASLTDEANFIPIFAQRSTFVGEEYAIPYHVGYYSQFHQRVENLIAAHYTADLSVLQDFIQTNGVDFFVVAPNTFKPNWIVRNSWLMQFQPGIGEAVDRLKQRQRPALARLINRCSVLEPQGLRVVAADCILQSR
ncbi:MAG: hypothetical protein HC881_04375 [Leptolyngbyaceae cyanobacterium SL_7_1]|nr:hypothetical protein [Leptolyngbyaceae cyanobacterium SL_7_1]